MKKFMILSFLLFAVCICIKAQSESIIEDLNSVKANEGNISIYQDDAITKLIGAKIANSNRATDSKLTKEQLSTNEDGNSNKASKKYISTKGYRILVYSGSEQKKAKNEAQSRRNTIHSSFPNMEVSISYSSPVWRVKAGNFRNREQAAQALSEMKSRFPNFGKEMYIVSDIVRVPVD